MRWAGLTLLQHGRSRPAALATSTRPSPPQQVQNRLDRPGRPAFEAPESFAWAWSGSRCATPTLSTSSPGLFGNVATFKSVLVQTVYNQSNIQPVYDVRGSVQDQDPGAVSSQVTKVVDSPQPGLLFAAVFVYMPMVVNDQSLVDPLAVVLALPGAGCGIIAMLYVTKITFSVPSLMGAIMSVGVASANSILLVTVAREQRATGVSTTRAALSAARGAGWPGGRRPADPQSPATRDGRDAHRGRGDAVPRALDHRTASRTRWGMIGAGSLGIPGLPLSPGEFKVPLPCVPCLCDPSKNDA